MNKVAYESPSLTPTTDSASKYNIPCMPHLDAIEESTIKSIEPYKLRIWGEVLFWVLAICTGGLYYLIDHWFLFLHLLLRYKRVPGSEAKMLVIKTMYFTDITIQDIIN
ncbi:unnamed protein product [Blepharisma stoltei]|uniref:Cation-transporting ATPase n=1 Tax=Blepharisma stoltei TaxID=1481888 RepID=A0AAU9J025_9CILI|nr:unnamed protein product [Blepharisma stoltei]